MARILQFEHKVTVHANIEEGRSLEIGTIVFDDSLGEFEFQADSENACCLSSVALAELQNQIDALNNMTGEHTEIPVRD